jgi:hypothetical protein
MQNDLLFAPSPDPFADALQFFDGKAASGVFGGSNDLLGYYMVDVLGKAAFFAGKFLQPALRRARPFPLEFCAETAMPMADGSDFTSAVEPTVRVGGDLRYSEIDPKELCDLGDGSIGHHARRHQIPFAPHASEIGFSLAVGEQGALALAADKRNAQPARERPEGHRRRRQVVGQNAPVIGRRASGAEGPAHSLIQLVSIGGLRDRSDGSLRRQFEPLAHRPVAELVQIELAEGLRIPGRGADVITGGVRCRQRVGERGRLGRRRLEFQLRRQMHSGPLLLFDVLLHRGGGNRASAAHVVAPAPERRKSRFQRGELLAQFVSRVSLDLIRDVLRRMCRRSLHEPMHGVGHYFKCHDLTVQLTDLLANQRAQGGSHTAGKHFAPEFRTPDEVVRQRRNTAAKLSVTLDAHILDVTSVFDSWKHKNSFLRLA